jgi:hypothetical protein
LNAPPNTHAGTVRRRIRDLLLYCLIGILLVAVGGVYAVHQGRLGQTSGLPLKWLGFGIMTALVFGNAIRHSEPFWRSRRFWGLLAVFSILHFGFGFVVLLRLRQVGLIEFLVATLIENALLNACLGRFLNRK